MLGDLNLLTQGNILNTEPFGLLNVWEHKICFQHLKITPFGWLQEKNIVGRATQKKDLGFAFTREKPLRIRISLCFWLMLCQLTCLSVFKLV